MKKRKLILMISAICTAGFLNNVYANSDPSVCNEENGKLYCGAGQIDGFMHLGDTVFDGTTVSGTIRIIGDTEIHNSQINKMTIIGDFTASDSSVNDETSITGDTTLTNMKFNADAKIVGNTHAENIEFRKDTKMIGNLEIKNTNFKGLLTLASGKTSLSHCTSTTINFSSSNDDQILYLNQSSSVNGDINFSSNRGTVYLARDSRINGKVSGGKIIKN